ncbi:hypothetical protein FACS1894137_06890 [Spirochaetia bacterium]|nr:hypothetical protein FACS1894137_06890 [Spirochaetia bacterium]
MVCYVESKSEDAPLPNNQVTVNYYFDRTESMKGFTKKGDTTKYGTAIDTMLTVGRTQGYQQVFYKVGQVAIGRIKHEYKALSPKLQDPGFYGNWVRPIQNDPDCDQVESNKESEYAINSVRDKINEIGAIKDNLHFIVTDLYETGGANEVFTLLYQDAFSSGASGAIFAVKSAFNGSIYEISKTADNSVRVNGNSTFFILVLGNKDHIKNYSMKFAEDLKDNGVEFNYTFFLLNDPDDGNTVQQPEPKPAGNKKRFELEDNKYTSLNIRSNRNFIKTWVENKPTSVDDVEAYVLLTDIGSQYLYKVKEDAMNAGIQALPRIDKVTLEYFPGSKAKKRGELSKFDEVKPSDKDKILTPSVIKNEGFNYFKIDINNKNARKGYYRIKFNIIPDWVEVLNAPDVDTLKKSSIPGETVKVLHLGFIYNSILNEYNNAGKFFSKVFYLIKTKN